MQMSMNVSYLHVNITVLTTKEALSVTALKGMLWVMTNNLVKVYAIVHMCNAYNVLLCLQNLYNNTAVFLS